MTEGSLMNTLFRSAEPNPRTDVESLSTIATESFFATDVVALDPSVESRDPAERLSFTSAPIQGVTRFDLRSDQALTRVMFEEPASMERERAIWEYADRHRFAAMPLLREIAAKDADPSIRWTTLWLMQKVGGRDASEAIAPFMRDDDP